MESNKEIEYEGYHSESDNSREGWMIRLKGNSRQVLSKSNLREMYEFARDMAAVHLNFGSAGIVRAEFIKESENVAYIDLRFGDMATFGEVVDISRSIARAGDLNCIVDIHMYESIKP